MFEEDVKEEEKEKFKEVGIELDSSTRSGTFLQEDQFVKIYRSIFDGLEVMSIRDALKKYEWLKDYLWKALKRDQDDHTKEVAFSEDFNGYFIRAFPGEKIDVPVESCLYLKKVPKQKVHSIVIAEEGAELNIISGCTAHTSAVGMHIGLTEFFVKKDAKLSFTMIHSWNNKIDVRPRSAAIVEENGTFISNYVLLNPVKSVQSYPTAYVEKDGKALLSSVIVALEGCKIDSGSRAILRGERANAEIISRTVSKGGEVIARGHIVGGAPAVKGHLECKGLILSEKGFILAIPELEARYPNVELSHEAAIGKIAEEEIFYLMTRGLSRDEAISAIVRGFLDIEIKGLPKSLKQAIDQALSLVEKQLF